MYKDEPYVVQYAYILVCILLYIYIYYTLYVFNVLGKCLLFWCCQQTKQSSKTPSDKIINCNARAFYGLSTYHVWSRARFWFIFSWQRMFSSLPNGYGPKCEPHSLQMDHRSLLLLVTIQFWCILSSTRIRLFAQRLSLLESLLAPHVDATNWDSGFPRQEVRDFMHAP